MKSLAILGCILLSLCITCVWSQALFYKEPSCTGEHLQVPFTFECQNLPSGHREDVVKSFNLLFSDCITLYDRRDCLGHELANIREPGCRKLENLITTARSFRMCSGRTFSVTVMGK